MPDREDCRGRDSNGCPFGASRQVNRTNKKSGTTYYKRLCFQCNAASGRQVAVRVRSEDRRSRGRRIASVATPALFHTVRSAAGGHRKARAGPAVSTSSTTRRPQMQPRTPHSETAAAASSIGGQRSNRSCLRAFRTRGCSSTARASRTSTTKTSAQDAANAAASSANCAVTRKTRTIRSDLRKAVVSSRWTHTRSTRERTTRRSKKCATSKQRLHRWSCSRLTVWYGSFF